MQPINPNLGGKPGNTIDFRKEYGRYNVETQMNGQSPLPWEDWLKTKGLMLRPDGMVMPKSSGLTGLDSLFLS